MNFVLKYSTCRQVDSLPNLSDNTNGDIYLQFKKKIVFN